MNKSLPATGDKILVEASPYYTIWCIGLEEDSPEVCVPELWRGFNRLGFILMEIRDEINDGVKRNERLISILRGKA